MRRLALLLFWPLAAWPQAAATAPPGEPKSDQFCSIEGHVFNAATGEPVGKAALLLMRADTTPGAAYSGLPQSYAANSDASGKFVIRNVEPGSYRMRATRNGFVMTEYGARASQRSGTVLALARAQQLKDIDLRLTPHGVISGRVLDADGEPLAGVYLQLMRPQYLNGRKQLAASNTSTTNDLGEYRAYGLAPGKYYISAANRPEMISAAAPVTEEDYVVTFYPGVTDSAAAVPVEVSAGEQVRGIDVVLRKARTFVIKGKVVNAAAPGVRVNPTAYITARTGDALTAMILSRRIAQVNAAGEFEFRGVAPGPYTITASISQGGRSYSGRAMVDIGSSNIEGVIVTIAQGVPVNGRIRVEGDSQEMPNLMIRLQTGTSIEAMLSGGSYSARVVEDRTFKFESVDPDRYEVTVFGLPDGFYVKTIRAGDADITTSRLELSGGAPPLLDILLSSKAGQITGVAQNPNTPQPAPGATVVLVPQEKDRRELQTYYKFGATDQYGRFTLRNLAPGEYKVFAWEDVESGAWMDPDFMKPLDGKGESVTVREGGSSNVQVTLIPAESPQPKTNERNQP